MRDLSIINTLRGVAAIAVMLFHFTNGGQSRHLLSFGQLGVHVFFVLSGFVIPLQLSRRHYKISSFPRFFINRWLRIYPTAFAAITLSIIIWVLQNKLFSGSQPIDLSAKALISNFTLTNQYFGYNAYLGVCWTLFIEFFYYVVLGLAYPCLFSKKTVVRVSCLALLLGMYYTSGSSMWNFFKWSPYFVIGMTLFGIKQHMENRFQTTINYIFLFAAMVMVYFDPGFNSGISQLTAVILTTLLILYSPNIKNKVILYFGKISFSLYLIHQVSGGKILAVAKKLLPDEPLYYIIALSMALPFSVICAHLLYQYIEKPSHIISKGAWNVSLAMLLKYRNKDNNMTNERG